MTVITVENQDKLPEYLDMAKKRFPNSYELVAGEHTHDAYIRITLGDSVTVGDVWNFMNNFKEYQLIYSADTVTIRKPQSKK